MGEFVKLFTPGNIGTMKLKNRIIMEPHGMQNATEPGGYTTNELLALWGARARGGVALIHMTSHAFAKDPPYAPNLFNICDDKHLHSAERLTRALKAHDTKVSLFINHPGRSLSQRRADIPVVGPSAIRHPLTGIIPKELSKEEINEIIEDHAIAAKRGKTAGFDAVTIIAGHGYLISQFLSLRTNIRTDEYGGTIENRTRFGCEVIRRTREKVGPDFPIIVRMNGDDYVEGGVRIADAVQQATFFADAGADALDVDGGTREGRNWFYPGHLQPYNTFVHLAEAVKKKVKVPVCAVGKITPSRAERILEDGSADFVGMLRPLIADPELPNKLRNGKADEVRPCLYCNQCLVRRQLYKAKEPRYYCSVNPSYWCEEEYERGMEPARTPKKVMVIGGGLAGMEAARTLAKRGHKTTLFEKGNNLGGQYTIFKAGSYAHFTSYLSREVEKSGVKVVLNSEVNVRTVEEAKPDAVVVATGARPKILDVPGANGINVVLATDVLMGKVRVGNVVVVVGGRHVGLEIALLLAKQGKKVSVATRSKIGRDLQSPLKLAYKEYLIKLGVFFYPDSVVESITENGVNFICDGEIMFLKADTVVLAIGCTSDNGLVEELREFMPEVYTIGDCAEPRNVVEAVNEGSMVGREI